MTRLVKGQKVRYSQILGFGVEPRWSVRWYRIVEPVSPYNPNCALIVAENPGTIERPFNAAFHTVGV